jgi:subtilisin family serine protease
VRVVVVDTGWNPDSATDGRTPWLKGVEGDDEHNDHHYDQKLRQYAGHGTFIAGVVRCMAPRTKIFVEGFAVNGVGGGGILESDIVEQLEEAMDHDPQVINLSAGCRTRNDWPSIAFQTFYEDHLEGRDCVLVAAAGNDGWAAPFWPAAFDWAVGVGSLDRDGRVSDFSNYGVSADVYTLGRNLVNAFPDGTYECKESPDKGDLRQFRTGMARWSGTSFAAPVVAGLIAREISLTASTAEEARKAVLKRAVRDSDPVIGPHWELDHHPHH